MATTKLFAFWRYDQYPYILGAPVLEMRDDGFIKPEGYGGYCFKPIKLLPLEAGKKLYKTIEQLKKQHWEAESNLRKEWIKKLNDSIPEDLVPEQYRIKNGG